MHETQRKLLLLSKEVDIKNMPLRKIGYLIGENHPQKIKHHVEQLKKKGFDVKESIPFFSLNDMISAFKAGKEGCDLNSFLYKKYLIKI